MSGSHASDQHADLAEIIADTARAVFADLGAVGNATARSASETGAWLGEGWAQLDEAGFLQAMRPEDAGGIGIAAAMQIVRLSGSAALPLPLAEAMAADWLLAQAGLPAAERPTVFLLRPLALSTSGAGVAVRDRITHVAWARHCDLVCIAMIDGAAHLVLLERSRFSVEQVENLAGEPRDTVVIECVLPRSAFTPLPGADDATPWRMGAALRAAQIAGAVQEVLRMTTDYAGERAQFGKTLSRFQAVQQVIAVMAGEAAAAGVAGDMAAQAWEAGLPFEAVATTKIRAGEAAGKIAAAAHQIHGAIGFTREHALQLLTRRLWSWRDEFGDEAAWSVDLGRRLVRDGGPLWHAITDFSK